MSSIIIAAITALPATIAAIVGLIIGLRNSKKADDIHFIVNGDLHDLRQELSTAKNELVIARNEAHESREEIRRLLKILEDNR